MNKLTTLVGIAKTMRARLPETEQNEMIAAKFDALLNDVQCSGCDYLTEVLFEVEGCRGKYCSECQCEIEVSAMEQEEINWLAGEA